MMSLEPTVPVALEQCHIVESLPALLPERYTFRYTCKDGKDIPITLPLLAAHDENFIRSWLYRQRSAKTELAYSREIARFYQIVNMSAVDIQKVEVIDRFMQHEQIAGLKPSSQARALAAVKSLLSYASNTVVAAIPVNVGAAVPLPRVEDTLAERIMSEQSVDDMLRMEPNQRNQAMLELLYFAALRVDELCHLKWRHLQERNQSGQIAVFGKGQKMRYILLDGDTWVKVWALRQMSLHNGLDDYVFTSRQGKVINGVLDYRLDPRRVHQIVRAAADRAGVAIGKVSPHWLRHAHASHALDSGEPISLVSATLGHASVGVTGRYLHVRPNASSAIGLRAAQKKRKEGK